MLFCGHIGHELYNVACLYSVAIGLQISMVLKLTFNGNGLTSMLL